MSLIKRVTSSIARTYQNTEFNLLSHAGKVGEVARTVKATVMSLPAFCPAFWANKPPLSDDNFEHLIRMAFGPLFRGVAADVALLVGHMIPHRIAQVTIGGASGALGYLAVKLPLAGNPEDVVGGMGIGEGLIAGAAGTILTPSKAALLAGGLVIFDPKKFVGAFVTNGGYHLLGRFFTSATMSSLAAEGFISCADYACRIFSSLFKNNQARLEIQLLMRHFERKKTDSKPVMHIVSQYLGVAPSDPTEKEQQARVSALYEMSTKKAS